MPLIACPECQGQVSDAAASCPHCGHPLSPAAQQGRHAAAETPAPSTPAAPAPAAPTLKARPWLIAAGVLLVIGSLMPWAQAGIFSLAGTSGDGVLTLIAGVIIGALALIKPTSAIPGAVAMILSIGCVLVIGNVLLNFADTPENIGTGLLVTGLGAVVAFIAGARLIDDSKSR